MAMSDYDYVNSYYNYLSAIAVYPRYDSGSERFYCLGLDCRENPNGGLCITEWEIEIGGISEEEYETCAMDVVEAASQRDIWLECEY